MQKVDDTSADILKVLDCCHKNPVALPKFVIYEPDEVPTILSEASATLTRKVNDLFLEFKNFVFTTKARGLCCPSMGRVPGLANPVAVNPHSSFAVLLKMLKSLDNRESSCNKSMPILDSSLMLKSLKCCFLTRNQMLVGVSHLVILLLSLWMILYIWASLLNGQC